MTESSGEAAGFDSVEQEPLQAATVFGEHIDVAREFTHALAERGVLLGLIGPRELPVLWSRHILNSALVSPLLRGSVADVGSGAGLPGLVLAIARPELSVTLIEPMERRCAWLRSEAERLSLVNVRVLRSRAQDVDASERFDVVTARAVAALKKLVLMTAPLVAEGGEVLFMKGARAADEIADAETALRKAGLVNPEVRELGADLGLDITWLVRAQRARLTTRAQ